MQKKKYGIRPFSIIWWLRGFGFVLLIVALMAIAPGTSYAGELVQLSTDPTQPCNLTEYNYDYLLDGTDLEGLGRTIAVGEKLYKVNGLFVAAIIAHESGWGTSYSARERNNLGGIKGSNGYRSFYNKQICILYMFSLLDRLYISQGRDTIEKIAPKYCETGGWADSVSDIMEDFILRASITTD